MVLPTWTLYWTLVILSTNKYPILHFNMVSNGISAAMEIQDPSPLVGKTVYIPAVHQLLQTVQLPDIFPITFQL